MVCSPSCILKLIGEMEDCGKIAVSFPICVPPKRKSEIALRGSDSMASGVVQLWQILTPVVLNTEFDVQAQ